MRKLRKTAQGTTNSKLAQALRTIALRYPEAEEAIACEGTALESSVFRARKKSFLFVGAADVKVKLRESQAEATRLASKDPSRYRVGGHGWISVSLSAGDPPLELLERWVDESYREVADKRLLALLPERALAPVKKRTAAKRARRSSGG
jgi:predicted DNA-binding protein (MmcQ/YjbR family)